MWQPRSLFIGPQGVRRFLSDGGQLGSNLLGCKKGFLETEHDPKLRVRKLHFSNAKGSKGEESLFMPYRWGRFLEAFLMSRTSQGTDSV